MGVVTVGELKQSASGKRTLRPSLSSRHHAQWPLSDVSSDFTVEVGTTSFSLHKFPLVSRSGKIRKLLSEAKDPKLSQLNLQMVPGGAEAFELAAKFCYGVGVDITLSNVAMLRCAAHHLQMTEEVSEKNLESRAEAFIRDMVLPSIANSITVLHHCESLLPAAEEVNLVGRIVSEIAANACQEQLTSGLSMLEIKPMRAEAEASADWWGKSLGVLGLDLFQRVISAVRSKGLKQDTISRILIHYAHNSLHGLAVRDAQSAKGGLPDTEAQKQQRTIVEAMVGLLPNQSRRSHVPMGFLSGLLKAATGASASPICRADLERRMAMQLDQAILEDVLVPAGSCSHNHLSQLYDTDVVLRIFSIFLNLDEEEDDGSHLREEDDADGHEFGSPRSVKQSLVMKVSKLMDGYLAEVALDSNLMASKFITLAELLPDHARVVSDGLYRAVDIFLKVHPNMRESERYRLCKTVDCQKLSQEACSHAAQNERLPVQMAVQVLYFEQLRLRSAMNRSHDQFFAGGGQQFPHRSSSAVGSGAASPRDNYALVRRENRELKLEVARMRMRLTDLEKDHVSMKQDLVRASPATSFLRSFSRKLCKLNEIFRLWEKKTVSPKSSAEARLMFQRRRRNSI